MELGGSGDADAAGHDPGGDGHSGAAEHLVAVREHRWPDSQARAASSWRSTRPIRRSWWRSGWTTIRRSCPSRTTTSRWSWRGPIRSTAARAGFRSWVSRPTDLPDRSRAARSRRPPARRSPTSTRRIPAWGSTPAATSTSSTEYHNAVTAAASSSGAVALQKYSFTGSTPAAQAFTTNQQTPNPYGGGGFGGGTSNLKVIYQWDVDAPMTWRSTPR